MTSFPGIYRNVYYKDYAKFPYQKLTGRKVLLYTGKVMKVDITSMDFDARKDYFFDCDCKYPLWKELKHVFT